MGHSVQDWALLYPHWWKMESWSNSKDVLGISLIPLDSINTQKSHAFAKSQNRNKNIPQTISRFNSC